MQIWTLLRLSPQHQPRYIDHLNSYYPEVTTYFPLYPRKIRPARLRRVITVYAPVYPGYVFVRFDPLDGIHHQITRTPIRSSFVRFGPDFSIIPTPVIEELRRLESLHLLVQETYRESPYTPGKQVRVMTPILDIDAIIIRLVGSTRALVDTDIGRFTVQIHSISFAPRAKAGAA